MSEKDTTAGVTQCSFKNSSFQEFFLWVLHKIFFGKSKFLKTIPPLDTGHKNANRTYIRRWEAVWTSYAHSICALSPGGNFWGVRDGNSVV